MNDTQKGETENIQIAINSELLHFTYIYFAFIWLKHKIPNVALQLRIPSVQKYLRTQEKHFVFAEIIVHLWNPLIYN
jgi:hypothetical protein